MAKYIFAQLVDLSYVRYLLESHHSLTGMVYGVFDSDENNLIAVGGHDVCVLFHCVNFACPVRCRESDSYIKAQLQDFKGDFLEYRCKNGLAHVAVPIVIDGEHLLTLFAGHFFCDDDKPDPEFFRAQAEEFGFDPESYLDALERVPVFSRNHMRDNMRFLRNMLEVLAKIGLNSLKLTREVEESRRKVEEVHRQNEVFRSLAENAPDAIVFYDRAGWRSYVNPSFEKLTGKPAALLVGTRPAENYVGNPEVGSLCQQAINRVINEGVPEEIEVQFEDVAGTKHCFQICFVPEFGHDGMVVSVLSIGRDVTALRDAEQRLSRFVANAPGFFYTMLLRPDGSFYIPFASSGITELFGFRPGDVAEDVASLSALAHPDDVELTFSKAYESAWTLTPYHVEYRIRHPEKGERWLEARSLPQREQDGGTLWHGFMHDVTERKRAEQNLQKAHEFTEKVIYSMPDPVFVKDRQHRWILLNDACCSLIGHSRGELIGKSDHNFFPKEEADAFWEGDELAFTSGQIDLREEPITDANGNTRYIQTKKIPLVADDGKELLIGIIRDITERHMMQNELIKSQKLESLGVLAGGIAHDFNNILTGIMGNISFARVFLDESHRVAKILREAEKASERATDLARQLLTFAKGGQPIKQNTSAKQIIAASASFALRGTNVSSVIEVPDNLHAIYVDEGQINQVFNNIIINAVHAMPDGGTITIKAENIRLDGTNMMSLAPGKYVRITFADTGCGMSDDIRKRIFEPYFTTKAGGNGLGLASAYSIVSKHGGHISVRSTPGKGTTFDILLPAGDEQVPEPEADMTLSEAVKHSGGSLLVMDDEEMIRDVTTVMLGELGYHVQTCSNGEEAIALYKAAQEAGEPFSAVIMDLTIPGGMGGKEAARHILNIDPAACLIVSSGYSNDPVMEEYSSFGFRATIVKPYNLSTMAQVLKGMNF